MLWSSYYNPLVLFFSMGISSCPTVLAKQCSILRCRKWNWCRPNSITFALLPSTGDVRQDPDSSSNFLEGSVTPTHPRTLRNALCLFFGNRNPQIGDILLGRVLGRHPSVPHPSHPPTSFERSVQSGYSAVIVASAAILVYEASLTSCQDLPQSPSYFQAPSPPVLIAAP